MPPEMKTSTEHPNEPKAATRNAAMSMLSARPGDANASIMTAAVRGIEAQIGNQVAQRAAAAGDAVQCSAATSVKREETVAAIRNEVCELSAILKSRKLSR